MSVGLREICRRRRLELNVTVRYVHVSANNRTNGPIQGLVIAKWYHYLYQTLK
jgi:hypothetical protein